MVETDQIETSTTDEVESNWKARGALEEIVDKPDQAIRIASTPEPMFVTVDGDELAFWCFDYSKECQVRHSVEDGPGRFETVPDQVHAYANSDYPLSLVDRDVIDDEPKPVATGLDEFTQGGA